MTKTVDLSAFDALPMEKQNAFLALFAGARGTITVFVFPDGKKERPFFGKAECEWVEDWEDFYGRELSALGWLEFRKVGEPQPALGMVAGSTWYNVDLAITDLGWDVREAVWARFDEDIKRQAQEYREKRKRDEASRV